MSRHDPLANPLALLPRVHAYVAYRIGPGADAEDVTSETFARAVRYRESYDSSKGAPLGWLIGIARRCVDEALAERRAPEYEADPVEGRDLEQRTIDRLTLKTALERLSPRDRELIGLRYGADLSAREIGALLDIAPNAVDVALHRCLARLRALLEAGNPM